MHWVKRECYWQWVVGGLGNGTRIQFYGKWIKNFEALPLLPFHYPLRSRMGRLLHPFLMDKKQRKYLRIKITLQKILKKSLSSLLVAAVYNASPLWCQSGSLPLNSLPLDEHAADW